MEALRVPIIEVLDVVKQAWDLLNLVDENRLNLFFRLELSNEEPFVCLVAAPKLTILEVQDACGSFLLEKVPEQGGLARLPGALEEVNLPRGRWFDGKPTFKVASIVDRWHRSGLCMIA